jgi:predicted RNase H-like HicB family nuclease
VKTYSAVIERDPDTGLFVGFVPGFPGAHSQGATLDELNANLHEVISMLLEDGDPVLESDLPQIAKDIGLTVGEMLEHR